MTSFVAKTDYGRFKVTINDVCDIDLMTRQKIITGKQISVGGNINCVSIKALNSSNEAHFLNVKRTNDGCELNGKQIRGDGTVHMILLAFTIVKNTCPHITHIFLEDMSDFSCKRRDGSTVGISLALYELMFHRASWYERHFNAILVNPTLMDMYEKAKVNFSQKPPANFDFNSNELNIKLREALVNANSWSDFFDYVYTLDHKCDIIFPWYNTALSLILNRLNIDRQNWIIDLSNCEPVSYIRQNIGGRWTRRRKGDTLINLPPEYQINYSYKWLNIDHNRWAK